MRYHCGTKFCDETVDHLAFDFQTNRQTDDANDVQSASILVRAVSCKALNQDLYIKVSIRSTHKHLIIAHGPVRAVWIFMTTLLNRSNIFFSTHCSSAHMMSYIM